MEHRAIVKAVIGGVLWLTGTGGFAVQRIVDTLFTVHDWTLPSGGANLLLILSGACLLLGLGLWASALGTAKHPGGDGSDSGEDTGV